MSLYILFCVVGFFLLYFGAGWLVRGASALAAGVGVTPLVIGLTVVAFGTSAPELVVSLVSALQGKNMIAVGNIIGSNICNIALVLGISALFQPIVGQRAVIAREMPIMLAVSCVLLFFSLDSIIGRIEGILLFSTLIGYIFMNYRVSVRSRDVVNEDNSSSELDDPLPRWKQLLLIITGIAGVIIGAQLVVDAATKIMQILGVNEKFIGLTIVAFGTSLPELATSVVAAIRKEMDISLGNLVGSNIFNILSVIGMTATIHPIGFSGGFIQSGLIVDYIVMIFISLFTWLLMRRNYTINRVGGGLLLGCYGLYFTYLVYML